MKTHPVAIVMIALAAGVFGAALSQPGVSTYEERDFLTQVRRLTVEGRRAGEGYWSPDGKRLVFQSEREPGNPFYQIYVLDFASGDVFAEQLQPFDARHHLKVSLEPRVHLRAVDHCAGEHMQVRVEVGQIPEALHEQDEAGPGARSSPAWRFAHCHSGIERGERGR